MEKIPTTYSEFAEAITKIDDELRSRDVSLHARSFHAVMTYAKRFAMDIPIPSAGVAGQPGNYSGESIGAHILNWYDNRYGDRQYVHMGPGSVIIMLRDDPWEIRLPMILGEVQIVIDRNLKRYSGLPNITQNGIHPTLNVLTLILELPEALAADLSDNELRHIMAKFSAGMEALNAIERVKDFSYVVEAQTDIAAAVRHVFSTPSHLGQSKWSSAQAAEKMLKAFLKYKQIKFPFNHNIKDLYALAKSNAMNNVDVENIEILQTRAAVRYGEESVCLSDAVRAHDASLAIGKAVVDAFLNEKKSVVDMVRGFSLAMDIRVKIMITKFDLGNQTKTFHFHSETVKYILLNSRSTAESVANISLPPIERQDWDGAITPALPSIRIDEFNDLVAMAMTLNRGITDDLGFSRNIWSFFVANLRQYEKYLVA